MKVKEGPQHRHRIEFISCNIKVNLLYIVYGKWNIRKIFFINVSHYSTVRFKYLYHIISNYRKIDHRSDHIFHQRSESDTLFEASSLLQIPIINKDSVLPGQEIHINIVQLGTHT